jgi:hypothetical protein
MRAAVSAKASVRCFRAVTTIGLTLPGVETATKYDGSPVLKVDGCFMAGLATHASAEPETLIVRADLEQRGGLLDDDPDTYYLTDYYRPHPVVLVRLSRIEEGALRDLLALSRRLTLPRTPSGRRQRHDSFPQR